MIARQGFIKDYSLKTSVTLRRPVASRLDTNVLVYRFDRRFPDKQDRATSLLRRGIEEESLLVHFPVKVLDPFHPR